LRCGDESTCVFAIRIEPQGELFQAFSPEAFVAATKRSRKS
jgi:hypothetical protein